MAEKLTLINASRLRDEPNTALAMFAVGQTLNDLIDRINEQADEIIDIHKLLASSTASGLRMMSRIEDRIEELENKQ